MKLKELKEIINSMHEDFFDLPVMVIADHGQTAYDARTASKEWVENEEGYPLHEDDVESYREEGELEDMATEVFLIGD